MQHVNGMKIAESWYECHALGDGITLIRETCVAAWLRCNIWHVRGREFDLLIDTGMGLRPLKKELAQLCERPIKVISTHCHFDHIGGAHEFDCRLGHRAERDIHAHPDESNTASWSDFVRAETFHALPYAGFTAEQFSVKPAPLTGYLDEGDVLDLGDRHFRIYHLPGHSPGSIALHDPDRGVLFSGDVIYDGDLFDTVYHSDREHYQHSLERLRTLHIDVVHGGHFNSFGYQRMLSIIDRYNAGEGRLGNAADWVDAVTRSKEWL